MTEKTGEPASDAQILGRVASALRRADLAMLAVKERPLRKLGTSGSLYAVLVNLHVKPGQTAAELARVVGVTPQAIQPLVSKLVERGWVERRSHARHAGIQELHLTDEGLRETGRADRVMAHLDDHLRTSLGPADYDRLADLLGRVVDHLADWSPPADA
ncbi:MarR family winged helix-turn-helix transcriptional regulator [Catenuloplanes indicus]|uniref:DNA-binding MarR family transcriptional regulator n=1 Tax=Catenuloplanes indicus TaxID=137267 RepID=A0AAE4AVE9_9ACTN|nr:MarR family transcriptional regulator [Catenuloplanes indicus]MDQ0363859.1 DNA-binding MarR family transcriptional regulator [Catenuloplanes indicus]